MNCHETPSIESNEITRSDENSANLRTILADLSATKLLRVDRLWRKIIANVINIDGGFAKVREKSKKYDSLKTAGDKKNETRHQK